MTKKEHIDEIYRNRVLVEIYSRLEDTKETINKTIVKLADLEKAIEHLKKTNELSD